jgi:serine/threonine protein kinase/tetratricopeptide (TPR) repeat protein
LKSGELASREQSPLPQSFGSFRVIGRLGEGGMGVVYRAQHVETGEKVAIKTVSVPRRQRLTGIRSEVLALSRLHHPGVVRIMSHGVEAGVPWYAMELLEGQTLADFLGLVWPDNGSPDASRSTSSRISAMIGFETAFDPGSFVSNAPTILDSPRPAAAGGRLNDIVRLFRKMCEPLAFLHGRGVVHRDLKPSNVFIRSDGSPVLVDFGLISQARGSIGREALELGGTLMGTVTYLSPEQIQREALDARTDLYALGCMLYQALTGAPPFRAQSDEQVLRQHLFERPVPPTALAEGIPPPLEELVLGLLAKKRRERIGHADDVARVLAELEGDREEALSHLQAEIYFYRPEFAGRDAALRVLTASLDDLAAGLGSHVLLAGESGIGKTFLAAEVSRMAAMRGMRVVGSECAPPGVQPGLPDVMERRGLPLQPLRPFLTAAADMCREQGPALTARLFGRAGKVIASQMPSLADLPGEEQLQPIDMPAEEAHRQLVEGVLKVVAAYADSGPPLLLIIDDLQWADELSLNILTAMSPSWLAEKRILVLGTFRSDEVNPQLAKLIELSGVRRIGIDRVGPEVVGRIAADMLAVPSLPASTVAFLAEHTEGVPYFVAEYLRAAVAEGLLYRHSGRWRFREDVLSEAGLKNLPLPGSIHKIMLRRLAALDPELRVLVDVASVISRDVDLELLALVTNVPEAIAIDRIKELVRREVFDAPEIGRYRFVHDKLRETTYAALPQDRREALHADVARLLEAHLTGRKDTIPYRELAHHYSQGKLWDKAIDYLEKAGEQAFASFAHHEAMGFFETAIRYAKSGTALVSSLRLARWERHVADSNLNLGKMQEAVRHAEGAIRYCGYRMPTSRGGWVLGLVGQILLRFVQSLLPGLFRVRSGGRQSLINEAAYVFNRLCEPFFLGQQPLQGFYCGFRDLNLAERVPPSEALARGYATMAMVVGIGPFGNLGRSWSDRSVRIARSLDIVGATTYCLCRGAILLATQADWKRARDYLEEAIVIANGRSDLRQLGEANSILGLVSIFEGDFRGGLTCAEALITIGKSTGDDQLRHWGRNQLVHALSRLGRAREGASIIKEMREYHASHHIGQAEKIFDLGGFALTNYELGDFDEAQKDASLVLQAIRQEGFLPYFLKPGLDAMCEVLLALLERRGYQKGSGDTLAHEARDAVARVRKFATLYKMAGPRALVFEGQLAWLTGRQDAALTTLKSALALAQKLAIPYDVGRAHFEIGRRKFPETDWKAHLQSAAGLFGEAGATSDVRRVEELLSSERTER